MSKKKVQAELERILGADRILSEQALMAEFSQDMTENPSGTPDFVAQATRTEEIVEIVKLANKENVPITPRVAGTNLGGLAIPSQGGIVLDLREMNRIFSVNEDEMYALIEPGVTFGDIKQYLDQNHPNLRMGYSLSPPYTSVICNMLLDGLSNLSHKHGSMAEWLNTVEAVMPTGEVMKAGAGALSDTWFARGPLPDLMGLFINWQGITGIVTKAAVQLWPLHEHRGRYFILTYDPESSFSMVRKLARMEILDDIGCLSWPTGKMLLGNENPTYRDPTEPEFFVYVDISSPSKKILKEKVALIGEVVEGYRKDGYTMDRPIEVSDIVKLNPEFETLAEFPTTLSFLLDNPGGGLTWVGTYGPTGNWEEAYRRGEEIMKKHGFPPTVVTRAMSGGHYAVLRFIEVFDKSNPEDVKRVSQTNRELCEMVLELDYIPYKAPAWAVEMFKDRIDPTYLEMLGKIKKLVDPNGIMNPGRWLF